MNLLNNTREKLSSVLKQIKQLSECEFPYPDSKDVLGIIEDIFLQISTALDGLDKHTNPDIVKAQCGLALRALFRYVPRLGFVLRSTDVRNAFEVFGPLLRIAREVLEPDVSAQDRTTKLLLSSEWNYSPVTYPQAIDLPGIVFIGLPAPESANPLLVPLSGHELGHSVWSKENLDDNLRPDVKEHIIAYITSHWHDYHQTFPYVDSPSVLTTNMFAQQTWAPALTLTLRHAQEIFCDFIGLRIFGRSYLQAYAYLVAPNVPLPRSIHYPEALKRVQYLVSAAESDLYNIDVPGGYLDLFQDRPEPNITQVDRFRLATADTVLGEIATQLAIRADAIIQATTVPRPSEAESQRILGRFKRVVPAKGCKCLADIMNAAWIAYGDATFWVDIPQVVPRKDVILQELVLKNIELLEVEQILEETQ